MLNKMLNQTIGVVNERFRNTFWFSFVVVTIATHWRVVATIFDFQSSNYFIQNAIEKFKVGSFSYQFFQKVNLTIEILILLCVSFIVFGLHLLIKTAVEYLQAVQDKKAAKMERENPRSALNKKIRDLQSEYKRHEHVIDNQREELRSLERKIESLEASSESMSRLIDLKDSELEVLRSSKSELEQALSKWQMEAYYSINQTAIESTEENFRHIVRILEIKSVLGLAKRIIENLQNPKGHNIDDFASTFIEETTSIYRMISLLVHLDILFFQSDNIRLTKFGNYILDRLNGSLPEFTLHKPA